MQVHLKIHVFQLSEEGAADDDETEDSVSTYRDWLLPAREFHNLWDSLVYEDDIKSRLLQYASTVGFLTPCMHSQNDEPEVQSTRKFAFMLQAISFGEKGVDSRLVSFNRTVLLHGPPGTGKTTLCKALAQKLVVRFSHRCGP